MAQLKDLIVLGASRFLNIIHGSIDGNAATADQVNHSLTITPISGNAVTFNGSSTVSLTLSPASFGLNNTTRLVGKCKTLSALQVEDDAYNVAVVGGNNVIYLDEIYGTGITTGSDSIGTYYYPAVGDIVRQGVQEYMCIEKDKSFTANGTTYTKNSRWILLGGNDIWYEW